MRLPRSSRPSPSALETAGARGSAAAKAGQGAWRDPSPSRAKIEHMGDEQGLVSPRPGTQDVLPDTGEMDVDRLAEQEYLDHAYTCLEAMSVRTGSAVADAAERAPGDWDATVAHIHLTRRLASISSDAGPLCFGRIDEEKKGGHSGAAWHIGRRHVEDERGEPVVVDWRAPVAVPFYRATFHDTLGLRRRRRFILDSRELVDLIEEDFEHPDSSALAAAGGLPDPLLAELGRARTGTMRDIVATIAGEQDRIIRAPLDVPIVVQGGPGTGKTAVGLHRAAFLLYEHRVQLEREGVLVLGPNRIFLSYIAEVLPSLGEIAVVQTTLSGLVPEWPVKSEDPPELATLKGDPRMVEVLAKACRLQVTMPTGLLVANSRWGTVRLGTSEVSELVEAALQSGGAVGLQRSRFRRSVARTVTGILSDRRAAVIDVEDVVRDLNADRTLQSALDRIWPARSATAVVRAVLGKGVVAEMATLGIFDERERAILRRGRPARSPKGWSEADLPLLDEAQAVLSDPPRRYGHVVVDEAQDLSSMAFRMVARRNLSGTSFTVLGDLAQATAPGSQEDWEDAFRALGMPKGARVEELTTGYRVPAQIMELANALLAATRPTLVATGSVRRTNDEPDLRQVDSTAVVAEVADEAAKLFERHQTVAVVALERTADAVYEQLRQNDVPCGKPGQAAVAGEISILRPAETKGLEFDAVIVVEPSDFVAMSGGTGLLYIALTRAVSHLSVVYSSDLTPALLPAA
jgi:AAA domain